MEYGICTLSAITCKSESNHKSEQTNQILFGEIYTVLEKTSDWYKIQSALDNYEGWIHRKHHFSVPENEFTNLKNDNYEISLELLGSVKNSTGKTFCNIPIGSSLPFFDRANFKINKIDFYFSGSRSEKNKSKTTEYSKLYLNTPYLWGGRTPLGIDCSGLVQMTYKLCGINLPRDSWQQEKVGTKINSLAETKEGDLVFFGNETKINHVGLLIDNQTVIHASGKVKIEKIDEKGIFGNEENDYTHFLKSIKRI
jgi:hypothetical protein